MRLITAVAARCASRNTLLILKVLHIRAYRVHRRPDFVLRGFFIVFIYSCIQRFWRSSAVTIFSVRCCRKFFWRYKMENNLWIYGVP